MKLRQHPLHSAICSRYRFVSLLRFVLFVLVAVSILGIVSVSYYSLYCSYRFHLGLIEAKQRQLWNTVDGVRERFIPILMPLCDRPHYLRRVLDGLAQVDGIEETLVIFSQDCAQPAITSLLVSLSSKIRSLILPHTPPYFSLPGYVHTNEYATSANVRFLLEFAFEHMLADGAILLESDLIPSVDFYRYHQWTYRTVLMRNDSKVLSVHAFNLHSANASDPYALFPAKFDSWGWSTARTRWAWLMKQWTLYNNWDTIVSRAAKRDGWICMLPRLSRTRMIGLKGINVNVKIDHERQQFEEKMHMSGKSIDYVGKEPKIEAG